MKKTQGYFFEVVAFLAYFFAVINLLISFYIISTGKHDSSQLVFGIIQLVASTILVLAGYTISRPSLKRAIFSMVLVGSYLLWFLYLISIWMVEIFRSNEAFGYILLLLLPSTILGSIFVALKMKYMGVRKAKAKAKMSALECGSEAKGGHPESTDKSR